MGIRTSTDKHRANPPEEAHAFASGEVLRSDVRPKTVKPANRAAARIRANLVHGLQAPAPRVQVKSTRRLQQAARAFIEDDPGPATRDTRPRDTRPSDSNHPQPVSAKRVFLRMSAKHAALLFERANAAGLTRSHYVAALLDKTVPAPVPPHHAQSILDLRASTHELAALATDLNAFSRLLGDSGEAQWKPVRASVEVLLADVRTHLALAAILIAELKPHWRGLR